MGGTGGSSTLNLRLFSPSRRETQYIEIYGHRAIYHQGWKAVTFHPPDTPFAADKWELYDTRNDFSLVNDLAATNPKKLKEMQEVFIKEAIKNRVLPIDDRSVERVNAKIAGRPDLMGDRTSLTLSAGMDSMSENVFINIKNRSFSITADVEIPDGGYNGEYIKELADRYVSEHGAPPPSALLL